MPATLAFSNDIDYADLATYREVHRVLAGEFGIEAEDSFWLFDPAGGEMALFGATVAQKGPRHDELLEEIAAGRLAILHSAGNFSKTNTDVRCSRAIVAEGLAYLREHARVPIVWTNHGDTGDIQNVGGDHPVYQQGDDPASDTYLLDLLAQYGVRYYWNDYGCRNDFVLAAPGQPGSVLQTESTRSGQKIRCFLRYRGALPKAPDAQTLCRQLSPENVDALLACHGTTVIYQHWCLHRDADGRPSTAGRPVFPAESAAALRRLADARDRGLLRLPRLTALLEELDAAAS